MVRPRTIRVAKYLTPSRSPARERGAKKKNSALPAGGSAERWTDEFSPDGGPYFGLGSWIEAFSLNDTSPGLPAMRYTTFSCLTIPGAGSPPKVAL